MLLPRLMEALSRSLPDNVAQGREGWKEPGDQHSALRGMPSSDSLRLPKSRMAEPGTVIYLPIQPAQGSCEPGSSGACPLQSKGPQLVASSFLSSLSFTMELMR